MKHTFFLLITVVLITISPAKAQVSQDFISQVAGSWEGEGTLFGQTATFSMKWESTLNDRFLGLKFQNNFTDNSGTTRQMQAHAYYNLKTNKGNWFDSRGQTLPLVFEMDQNSMTVFWGDEATEKGKTTYRIQNGAMEVEDFVFKDGVYVPFGSATYRREGKP